VKCKQNPEGWGFLKDAIVNREARKEREAFTFFFAVFPEGHPDDVRLSR
jgi:hypothetical protein